MGDAMSAYPLWALRLRTSPRSPHFRLESAQCHTAQGLAPQLARTQLILMKMEHGDQTQPCVLMLPDIWREIKKFMHL